ncbi:MAG: hypothetical protein QOI40_3910 [Alphaproteobacteria bacterium]|nr:hypothetical protein [Alphaproteobacteria bacterium]
MTLPVSLRCERLTSAFTRVLTRYGASLEGAGSI